MADDTSASAQVDLTGPPAEPCAEVSNSNEKVHRPCMITALPEASAEQLILLEVCQACLKSVR